MPRFPNNPGIINNNKLPPGTQILWGGKFVNHPVSHEYIYQNSICLYSFYYEFDIIK